jgi:phospholipid/cholesterol/gamma-HCH transport system substrate-binding protein
MSLFRKNYDIYLRAENAGNLAVQAQVRMSGVQVGTVSDIRLDSSGKFVVITLQIYGDYKIYTSARFLIEQAGFLGDQYIAIAPTKNEGPTFQNHDEAKAEPPLNLQEFARSAVGFVQRVDETAKRLNEAIADIRRLLLNQETLTNLAMAATNLRAASDRATKAIDSIDRLLTTNSPALTEASTNLVYFSQQLNQFAASLGQVVATNSPDINASVRNIESSTEVLKNLLEEVQSGKGPAGNLIKNEQLSADLTQIVKNLSITTSNLNQRGLWGILWSHKTPREKTAPGQGVAESPKSGDH